MTIKKLETNYYVDESTDTRYEFLFDYSVPLEAAEYFIEEDVRRHQQKIELGEYYGRHHVILQLKYLR